MVPETRLSRAGVSFRFTMTMSAFGCAPLMLVSFNLSGSVPEEIDRGGGRRKRQRRAHAGERGPGDARRAPRRKREQSAESFGAQRRQTRAIATS